MNVRLPMLPGRRGRAVLVDCGDHARGERRDARRCSAGSGLALRSWDGFSSLPPEPGEPDRRRRGRRAAGVGRQGARRERDRRGGEAHRRSRRVGRQAADPRRRRRRGHGSATTRGWRSSATRRARSARPTISRASPRSGFAARRCRASRRCRSFTLRTRARGAASGTEVAVEGGALGVVNEVGDARRHVDRGRRPLLQPARAPEVPEVGLRGVGADLAHRHAACAVLSRGRFHPDERRRETCCSARRCRR